MSCRSSLLVPFLLLAAAACKSTDDDATAKAPPPTRAEVADEVLLSAQVVALDPAVRGIVLRGEDGEVVGLQAGPAVRNYEQIAVGDTLRVRFEERLTAERLPAGSTVAPVEAAMAAGRAAEGDKPAAAVGAAVILRVRIESIDEPRAIVVFSTAAGQLIAHRLRSEVGRAFVKGLTVGDVVQLEYDERLALSVDKL